MKLGMYVKEAWYDLRKSRVYSAVYIIGTGFSLALVMAYLTVQALRQLLSGGAQGPDAGGLYLYGVPAGL